MQEKQKMQAAQLHVTLNYSKIYNIIPQSLLLDFLLLGCRLYQVVPRDLTSASKTRETGTLNWPTKSSLKYLSSSKTDTTRSSLKSSTQKLNSSPHDGFKLFFTTLVLNLFLPNCNLTYGSLNPFRSIAGRFLASITLTTSFIFRSCYPKTPFVLLFPSTIKKPTFKSRIFLLQKPPNYDRKQRHCRSG